MTTNLLAFPAAMSYRLMSHVNLLYLDGRLFASAGFAPGQLSRTWSWIVETVAAECDYTRRPTTSSQSTGPGLYGRNDFPAHLALTIRK